MSRPAHADQPGADSRAAYLVLLTHDGISKAMLFNAEQRYLAEVIDDPLSVDRLCGAGRRCDPPGRMALEATLAAGGMAECEILCFALGGR